MIEQTFRAAEPVPAARTTLRAIIYSFQGRGLCGAVCSVPCGFFCFTKMQGEISESEFAILEKIYAFAEESRPIKQRDLSRIAGTSLGMTNSILKRLTQKGWITIKKLNSRNIQYAVTLEGLNEIMRRSYHYFKRTIRNAVYYKDILDGIIRSAKERSIAAVILVGSSDLDFIVEHACRRHGVSFLNTADTGTIKGIRNGTFMVYAESIPENTLEKSAENGNFFYLSRLLVKQSSGEMI